MGAEDWMLAGIFSGAGPDEMTHITPHLQRERTYPSCANNYTTLEMHIRRNPSDGGIFLLNLIE